MLVVLRKIPAVFSVSEVGERTGERVLSPAPPAVVGGLVTSSPSNVELGSPAATEESVAEISDHFARVL